MSAIISRFVLVNERGEEDDYEYDHYREAVEAASARGGYAVIEREYTYDDSLLVWTPDGSDVWPPEKQDEGEE